MNKNHTPFNCIIFDINHREFEPYDVMPYFLREWRAIKKNAKPYTEDEYRGKPQNREELKQWFLRKSQYMFWSRCEYEIIVAGWPCTDVTRKIDIHDQIKMNIDVILDIFINNIDFKPCPQENTSKE